MAFRCGRPSSAVLGLALAASIVGGCDSASWGVPVPVRDAAFGSDVGLDAAARDGGVDANIPDSGRDAPVLDATHDVGVDAGRGLLCTACTTDADCMGNSYCVQLATTGQHACLVACVEEIPTCPHRFDCLNSVITPTPGPVCTPVGAPCCIDNDDDGYGDGIGCRGTDCDDVNADVHPMVTELCNGVDDDCDGTIDQGDPGGGVVCSTALPGACGPGVTHCVAGHVLCQSTATTTDETCNGIDDDCDAMIDEGPTGSALTQSCYGGPAGTAGVGLCIAGTQTCSGGMFGACSGEVRPATESCNGSDDDCNGMTDEGNPGGGVVCSTGMAGACSPGTTHCASGAIQCMPNRMSMAEICNGIDDNCNGSVDESASGGALTQTCYGGPAGSAGVGLCVSGSETCSGGSFGGCTGEVRPVPELCNGLDDNCDGRLDDGNPGGGYSCTTTSPGVCSAGIAQCIAASISCVPTITPGTMLEICDGLDDNCDGMVDEGFPGLAGPCSAGVGACTATGVRVCNAANRAGPPICNAVPGAPTAEICDGVDNNCNSTVDEGFPGLAGPCSAGVGACAAPGVVICNAANRAGPPICNAMPGMPTAEICDGIDNNCNGMNDEGFAGLADPCSAGVGACNASGVMVCNAANRAGPPICNAVPGSPTAEICDGIDNNCNGTIDEGFAGLAGPCSAGVGACVASGVNVCNPANRAGPPICNAVPGAPTAELCDGIDNNCNGSTDETFAGLGTACTNGLGVCLRGGVVVCSASRLTTTCTAPVVSGSAETCNYLDDDCNGVADNGFVNGSGVYSGNTNCGACGVDCTMIYAHPNAFGTCSVAGPSATCVMNCNAGSFDLNAVPNDGCEFSLDPSAIYVSTNDPMGADDGTCGLGPVGTGAGNHPCHTIAFGQGRASGTGRTRVLVADGLYTVDVTLVNGQGLLGGYRADTWERHLATTLTTVRGTSGAGHRRAITASNITLATLVEGFIVEGADASTAGANSYAIYVTGGTSALTFQNNVIYAGNGAPGAPGTDGVDGANGVAGSAGLDAIATMVVICGISQPSSAGGVRSCGGVSVNGGSGGGEVCAPVWDGTAPYVAGAARPGTAGSGPGGGAAGAAGYDGYNQSIAGAEYCNTCYLPLGGNSMSGGIASAGAAGASGAGGAGAASGTGSVVGTDWLGTGGGMGGAGINGGGGGGGGGGGSGDGRGGPYNCTDSLGATGGGGGSGACAGGLGTGATAGGGSFAIFIVNTVNRPILTGNTIYRAFGGTGGNGGRGGTGGVGGAGAAGGRQGTTYNPPNPPFTGPGNAGNNVCTGDGGQGGDGGRGGHGGGGGGGAGGVSYGIYASGTTGYGAGTNTFPASGGGGAGGGGGPSIGTAGTPGATGASATTN